MVAVRPRATDGHQPACRFNRRQLCRRAVRAVFFLAGTNFRRGYPNSCIVSGQKALFFPLLNAFDVHVPSDGLDTPKEGVQGLSVVRVRRGKLAASRRCPDRETRPLDVALPRVRCAGRRLHASVVFVEVPQ